MGSPRVASHVVAAAPLDPAEEQRRRRHYLFGIEWGEEAGEDENHDRHEAGVDKEHPPRPLGLASGTSWEPRNPTRSFAGQSITFRFLEALENAPWLQDIAVAAFRLAEPFTTPSEG